MKTQEQAKADVLGALERLLAHESFATAGRLGPFLRFLVTAVLDGRTDSLKESVLGVEVFGRKPDYDPRTDPIVRVEARRLRQRLAEYYEHAGATEPVRIELPKGGYTPVFVWVEPDGAPEVEPVDTGRRWRVPLLLTGTAAALLITALAIWSWRTFDRGESRNSVAVLPFVNLSPDRENEYFSDGLTDELIDALGRAGGLRVVARGLVYQLKGKSYDSQSLASRWNVGSVVEGSVRKSGDQLRITVQLTDTGTGLSLWSNTYQRPPSDAFAVQQEIASEVARALRVQLGSAPAGRRQVDPRAYNLYLQARYQWNRLDKQGFENAVRYARQAIQVDPGFVSPHVLLATMYSLAGYYESSLAAQVWEESRTEARQALAIDPESGEAYAALGFTAGLRDWNWEECEKLFGRALQRAPDSGQVHAAYAVSCLLPHGRVNEALAEFQRSLAIDPIEVFTNLGYGFALLAAGHFDQAIVQYRKTLELNATFPDLWWDTGMCLAYLGRAEEARRHFQKAHELEGNSGRLGAAIELALVGETEEAERLTAQNRAFYKTSDDFVHVARTYAVLGNVTEAVSWLRKAHARREPQVVWAKIDPRFRTVRQHPEFQRLLVELGL